jgi:opacity protein-like surface antigen
MNHRILTSLSLASLGWFAVQCCNAGEPDGWHYEFTPYLMTAGLNGDVGVRGVTTPVDASFGDILDNLDAGFMGHFMAGKGPWTLGLEAVYMNLESESSGAVTGPGGMVSVGGRLDVDTSLYIYQGTVAYRVLDDATRVDLLGGVRFTELDADLRVAVDFTPGIVFPGGDNVVSGSESWADFVVGARVLHPLNDTWALMGYADLGGGGSDFTYQLMAGVNWAFGENLSAKLGWRYLDWDYEDGGSVWDMAASGPYLGLGIRF